MPLGHAHNIYLNVAAETGLIGLGLYLLFWINVLAMTFRAIRRAQGLDRAVAVGLMGAWVFLGTHMLVDNLYVNNTHLLIGALLGLLTLIAARALHPASSPTGALRGPQPPMSNI
jgi:O-antigen ligase